MPAEVGVQGDWRITSTEVWDRDALDLVQPTFYPVRGRRRMIAIRGAVHRHLSERDGKPLVEWTWEGEDDGDPKCGRGWAMLEADGVMRGRIYIHRGDDTGFAAERAAKAGPIGVRARGQRKT